MYLAMGDARERKAEDRGDDWASDSCKSEAPEEDGRERHQSMLGLSVNVGVVVEKRGSIVWIGKLWGNGASHALGAGSVSLQAKGSAAAHLDPLDRGQHITQMVQSITYTKPRRRNARKNFFSPRGVVG